LHFALDCFCISSYMHKALLHTWRVFPWEYYFRGGTSFLHELILTLTTCFLTFILTIDFSLSANQFSSLKHKFFCDDFFISLFLPSSTIHSLLRSHLIGLILNYHSLSIFYLAPQNRSILFLTKQWTVNLHFECMGKYFY